MRQQKDCRSRLGGHHGYCSDTRYVDKLHEKQQQHQRLEASLIAYGYDVTVLPIILGSYGTIPISAVEAVHTLGIERKRANSCYLRYTRTPSLPSMPR